MLLVVCCLHVFIAIIENEANLRRAKNTASPHVGLEADVVDEVVFGRLLSSLMVFSSIEDFSNEVLRWYEIKGARSCIVSASDYILPLLGECEHDFNAVVIMDAE
ncbi:hypothetical protein E4P01_12900 [Pseudomonas sp. NCIMB 10586]|nr:hypothetical protein [Pseudomonas sp. NCIMB 10586]